MSIQGGMALAACLTACLAIQVRAGGRAGVTLPDQATVEGRTLILNGMGLRRATWLRVKVYVAGLDLAAIEAPIATFHGFMPDRVAKGDTFTFTYVPGTGVLVAVKDETRGTIPGAAFARSLFATWLGAGEENAEPGPQGGPPGPSLKSTPGTLPPVAARA